MVRDNPWPHGNQGLASQYSTGQLQYQDEAQFQPNFYPYLRHQQQPPELWNSLNDAARGQRMYLQQQQQQHPGIGYPSAVPQPHNGIFRPQGPAVGWFPTTSNKFVPGVPNGDWDVMHKGAAPGPSVGAGAPAGTSTVPARERSRAGDVLQEQQNQQRQWAPAHSVRAGYNRAPAFAAPPASQPSPLPAVDPIRPSAAWTESPVIAEGYYEDSVKQQERDPNTRSLLQRRIPRGLERRRIKERELQEKLRIFDKQDEAYARQQLAWATTEALGNGSWARNRRQRDFHNLLVRHRSQQQWIGELNRVSRQQSRLLLMRKQAHHEQKAQLINQHGTDHAKGIKLPNVETPEERKERYSTTNKITDSMGSLNNTRERILQNVQLLPKGDDGNPVLPRWAVAELRRIEMSDGLDDRDTGTETRHQLPQAAEPCVPSTTALSSQAYTQESEKYAAQGPAQLQQTELDVPRAYLPSQPAETSVTQGLAETPEPPGDKPVRTVGRPRKLARPLSSSPSLSPPPSKKTGKAKTEKIEVLSEIPAMAQHMVVQLSMPAISRCRRCNVQHPASSGCTNLKCEAGIRLALDGLRNSSADPKEKQAFRRTLMSRLDELTKAKI